MDVKQQIIRPAFSLSEKLQTAQLPVSACYQCKKCSGGCPLTFAMDLFPDQVIRFALLGQEDKVLTCSTIWVCSACETCTTRCPNGINIAEVMDWLKEEALARGIAVPQAVVSRFHQTFLESVRLGGGRLSEPLLLALYQLRSGQTLEKFKSGELGQDLRLGWELARRGRLRPKLPRRLKGAKEIKEIFKRTKK
jgi:heterodisulfide reductase subunit C